MAETRPVLPQAPPRVSSEATPERVDLQPVVPLDEPDQQALAIFERATIEMANRTPLSQPAEPFSTSADTDAPTATPPEPHEPPIGTQSLEEHKPAAEGVPPEIMKLAAEMKPAQDLPQDTAQDLAEALAEDIKPVETSHPIEPIKPAASFKLVTQLDPATIVSPAAHLVPAPPKDTMITPPAFRPMFDDHFRVALTSAQSLVVTVAILALVIGALGMAAYGWAAAHDWSCRLGLLDYCPPSAVPKPLAPPEIPS